MKRFFLLFGLCLGAITLFATHNRSGYIRVEQLSDVVVRATIVTLTDVESRPADRDTLTICWGDGQTERILRTNGDGQILENGFKRNIYVAEHIYAERGTYKICMTDPNRNGGILNVNPPNSAQIAFHLQTTIQLLDTLTMGTNTTPEIRHEPTDLAYVGYPFVFRPEIVDPDGDSIVIELITPMKDLDDPVPNFTLPHEVADNPDHTFTLDTRTGEVIWEMPELVGEYNVALLIKSFRNGTVIDEMVLDMQILVVAERPNSLRELQAEASKIKLFPNPVWQQQLVVEDTEWDGAQPYRITDQQGRILMQGQQQDRRTTIHLQPLLPGTYYLSVKRPVGWIAKPFVVTK